MKVPTLEEGSSPSLTYRDPLSALSPEQQDRLSQLLESYLAELELGQSPDAEAICGEHPELSEAFRWCLQSLDFLHHAAGDLGARDEQGDQPSPTPHQLGEFEIIREVGRGGMGVVYEAKQTSLGRRVAVKVLPFAAVLDQRQIARFRNEAQAAAQLHHPNIVPVHSVGTDRGVHYYSMPYIDGQSLDKAIEQLAGRERDKQVDAIADVSTADRISFSTERSIHTPGHVRVVAQLMLQAAEALQHAHEYGIVHRDIKPSNLLVDRNGKLWVTDFGLARCAHAATGVTMTGDLLGTVRYMSPEAAAGKGHLVDNVSDIYSMGVTLYELLTLRPPHTGTDRQQLLDRIQHQDAPPPRLINSSIPVDLETIVLKAIANARDARYHSADALAGDLRRFLDGKPPLAKRPTTLDRLSKWASRHRRLVLSVAGGLLLTALTAATAAALLSIEKGKTEAALLQAEGHLRQSRTNLAQAIEVVDRFGIRVAQQLQGIAGAETVRQRILEDTLADYEKLAAQYKADPEMRYALALCQTQIASMRRQLGQLPLARDRYQDALALYDQILDEQILHDEAPRDAGSATSDSNRTRRDRIVCLINLGEVEFQRGDPDAASEHYQQALKAAEDLLRAQPEDLSATHLVAACLMNQGNVLRARHDVDAARALYLETIEIQETLCAAEPDRESHQRELAVSYAQLAFLHTADDLDKADHFNGLAIAIHQSLVEQHPHDLIAISELATCFQHRAAIFSRSGQTEEAHRAYLDAIDAHRRLVRRAPAVVRYREQLAVAKNNLGQLLLTDAKDVEAAGVHLEEARVLLEQLVQESPQSPHFRAQLGGVLANLAPALEESDAEAARGYYTQAIRHQEWAVEHSPDLRDFRTWLSSSYVKYSRFLIRQTQPRQAFDVVMKRRALWDEEPERLYLVAREMAALAEETSSPLRESMVQEAVATWNLALSRGLAEPKSKQRDPAFVILESHPDFQKLGEQ